MHVKSDKEPTRIVPVHNPEEEMWVQWHHWRTNQPVLREEKYYITLTLNYTGIAAFLQSHSKRQNRNTLG